MTSRERVRLAFFHQEPDRIPVFEIGFNSPAASEILGRDAWVGIGGHVLSEIRNHMIIEGRDSEFRLKQVQDYIELYCKLELDIMPVSVYPADPAVPKGIEEGTWLFKDKKTGSWAICKHEPESDMYSEVDSELAQEGIPALERMVKRLETDGFSLADYDFVQIDYAVREVGDELCVLGGADVHFAGASWIITFLIAMKERPDLIERYLDAQLERTLLVTEEQLRRGVSVMWGGADLCYSQGPYFSPQLFRRFYVPRLKQITDLCHRYNVPFFKHTDGNIHLIEEDLLLKCGIDGIHPLEPESGMDMAYYKENYGKTVTLLGNVSCANTLVYGTKEEIEEETRHVIEVAAPGGGFVLSSSNTIHSQLPARNYLTMREAARKYGTYPIVVRKPRQVMV